MAAVDDETRGERGTWRYFASWRGGQIELGATAAGLAAKDRQAGQLITDERPGEVFHVTDIATWHIWDGQQLRRDGKAMAERVVIDYADRVLQLLDACRTQMTAELALQLDGATDAQRRDAWRQAWAPFEAAEKYHHKLHSKAGQSALVRYLADLCGCDEADLAEKYPGYLNTPAGITDLATMVTYTPHDPAARMTYCLEHAPDWAAGCPRFWQLLLRACGNDLEVACYMLKVLGYCLLGENPEQQIFFMSGPTKSGKSQLLYVVRSILGQLAHESGAELITVARNGRNARVENSVRGVRMVTITETSGFMTIDEGQVKRLTGEPVISVNEHYAKRETRTPVTFTIIIATNEMPVLTGFDDAMRERVIIIPMGDTIPAAERDKHIAARILAEESGAILALLIRACADYHRSGLDPPMKVQAATGRYAAEQNTTGNFVADCCVMSPASLNGHGAPPHIKMTRAWQEYTAWSQGSSRLGRNEFYEHLAREPGVVRNEGQRRFEGIVLKPELLGTGNGEVEYPPHWTSGSGS